MNKYSELKKISKVYKSLTKTFESKIKEYEKVKKKAKCGLCAFYRKELSNANGKLHMNCNACKYKNDVCQSYKDFIEAKVSLDDFEKDEYGKIVFETLDKDKPELIEIKSGKTIKWNDAFGSKYIDNVPGKRYKQLIGLFENNLASKYKIK